jgi:hypothetical protein
MGGVTNLSDSNATDANDNTQVVITDSSNAGTVDTVLEDGIRKLQVKATNVPEPLGNLFFEYAANGGSVDMNVNGGTTPVEFLIPADVSKDKVVGSMVFEAFDGGIKIDTFLGQNGELTNGIIVEIKSEDQVFQFQPIRNTQEFDSLFSFGQGRSYELIFASGNDSMVARFGSDTPFVIKPQGTYASDDYI